MPEGDTLHRAALELSPLLMGKHVRALTLRNTPRTEGLVGAEIVGVEARGKNLLVHFGTGLSLHVHLKMNGRIVSSRLGEQRPVAMAQMSAVLDTDEHRVVVYRAPIARLLRTPDLAKDAQLRELGPDLLSSSFDLDRGLARLRAQAARPLGEALLDQSVVAGIGNVWKSELCFTLRLDPFAPVDAYTDEELSHLLSLAHTQMRDNVYAKQRTMPDPFSPRPGRRSARVDARLGQASLSVYERAGKPCYDCGTTLVMARQGSLARSTYYCPQCQPWRRPA